jgi:hypothetical protein
MIWIHVSELAIDRMLAGELADADAEAMRDHAATCERCGALLADALAMQRDFAHEPALPFGPPVHAVDRPEVVRPLRRRGGAIAMAATVTALAAGVAIGMSWPRTAHEPGVTRVKGKPVVGCFVAHGNEVRRGTAREVVVPGDRLELFTTTTEPVWFAAISDDAAGVRSVYAAPRVIEAGREHVLPTSIELDATLGTETVVGVFCDHVFDPLGIGTVAPAGCTLDRFTLVKVAR